MIKTKEKVFFCGNKNTVGIKIKILNPHMGKFSDCVYKIFLRDKEYGIYNENLLDNHNFIECSMLANDIKDLYTLFKDDKHIINLTSIVKKMSIKNAIKQVIRYHFCHDMDDESTMSYSDSIDDFKQKIINQSNKLEPSTFILNGHDSMQNYYFIPYYIYNELYLAIVEQTDANYKNFDCSDKYDWNFDVCTHLKINKDFFIKILNECYSDLVSVLSHHPNDNPSKDIGAK